MSHPDPTYYHPSHCDCQGCYDRNTRIENENFRQNMEMLGKVISIPFKAADKALEKFAENERVAKEKREEIIAANQNVLSEMHDRINVIIDDLNEICKSRPIAPPSPNEAFYIITFFSIITSLVLFFTPYYIFSFLIAILYTVFYFYNNSDANKQKNIQYKEKYTLFEKELEVFMLSLNPKIIMCEAAIAELAKWYKDNDYILVNLKDAVGTAQAWPEEIELHMAGPSTEFKGYYSETAKNKFFPKYKLKYSKLWACSKMVPAPRIKD